MLGPRKVLLAALAATALLAAPALGVYAKPRGTYKLSDFGKAVGTLTVKRLKITKLNLALPEQDAERCEIPGRVGLAAKPALRRFDTAGGRYAYARRGTSVLRPKAVIFRIAGDSVGGTMLLLWDESGKTLTSGDIAIGPCDYSFTGNRR